MANWCRRGIYRAARGCAGMAGCVSPLAAQTPAPPADVIAPIVRVHRGLQQDGSRLGPAVWPGFRPDSVPMLFVLGSGGTLLLGWPVAAPEGMMPVPGVAQGFWKPAADPTAASTAIELGGRRVAQMTVATVDSAALRGLATHEAFHVFQASMQRDDRRFGRGENSFLVTRYPVFDAGNEAPYLLELALLRDALLAKDVEGARARAREFVATREARHRKLDQELAEFEILGELNEGTAEYALIRARYGTGPEAAAELARRLASIGDDLAQSIRLRFYSTGPAMAMLLDWIAGAGWKERLVAENHSLHEALATATGYRRAETALVGTGRARHAADRLEGRASRNVAALASARGAQRDSVLAQPGALLVLETAGMRVGLCGIDPQNLLQVSPGVFLHTRWVRLCAGSRVQGDLNTGTVEDRTGGTWRAVIGNPNEVTITANGAPLELITDAAPVSASVLEIRSPRVTLTLNDVETVRVGREIRIRFP